MQVVVKTPRIRLEGEVTPELVEYLRTQYGDIEVIEEEDDELVEVTRSEWYRSLKERLTPGENMKLYREMHGLSQEELGRKLGRFSRQNISNMENGHRSISKATAKRLAQVFDVSVEKFL
jgi:DNA-binding XRE family transcriptional regulator